LELGIKKKKMQSGEATVANTAPPCASGNPKEARKRGKAYLFKSFFGSGL